MKCIQCQTDNTLKDRTANNGRCKQCQHPFVFEPTAMGKVKVTDGLFAKAIADLSANDTLYFTRQQLFYLLEKRLQGKQSFDAVAVLVLIGFFTFFTFVVTTASRLATGDATAFFLPGLINVVGLALLWGMSANQWTVLKARRIAARCLLVQGVAIFILGLLLGLGTHLFPVFAYGVIVGLLAVYLGIRQGKVQQNTAYQPIIEWNQVEGWLNSWLPVNPIAKLLPAPDETALPATISPDVTAYSFDRLVVTDTAAIAQLLIANNFHFENNSAILSITGYPQSIFQTTMDMLRRNPDLKVYAFHDCTPRGLNLVHQLQTNDHWFGNRSVEIFDVGLVPRQVIKLPNVAMQQAAEYGRMAQQLPPLVRQTLSPAELAWLDAGNVVLLESLPPQRLIQALQRGIAGSRELPGANTGDSGIIWMGDGGSSYYGVESFG